VSGSGRAVRESIGRTQRMVFFSADVATKASSRPSGDRASAGAKDHVSGGRIEARTRREARRAPCPK